MGTRARLSWGIAVQVNGEDLQTGPALSYAPFPPFLIAVPPDLSGLLGNKNTRTFLVNPPASCISSLEVAPSPAREKGSLSLPWERTSSRLVHRGGLAHVGAAQRHQCVGLALSGIPFNFLLTVI